MSNPYAQGNLKQDLAHDPPCHPRAVGGTLPLFFGVLTDRRDSLPVRHPRYATTHRTRPTRSSLTETDCLTKNNYKEEKCQAQIDALYECCNAFYQERGDSASTVSCPKANLLRLKMKQRANSK